PGTSRCCCTSFPARATSIGARRNTSSRTCNRRTTRRSRSPSSTPASRLKIRKGVRAIFLKHLLRENCSDLFFGWRPMLKTLMGDHEVTKQFKTRTDKLNFIEVKGSAAQYFKRVVRDLEFDVAEMAIITHLIAKAHDKPYRLLPFTVLARYQHPFLVYNAARGTVAPEDLPGKRVGVRSYSVTTGAWIRHILAEDHGVDISRIKWVTFEEAHVAEFRDPPNVERAPAGKDINGMPMAGEARAPNLGPVPTGPQPQT